MRFISEKEVATRKDHVCLGCMATVGKGSRMHVQTNEEDGVICNIYICLACYGLIGKAYPHLEEFSEGGVLEWAKENCPEEVRI